MSNKIKLIILLVLLLLISILTFQVSANSVTYELDELGLEVSIPSTYDVITQDTPTSSPIFSDLGISGEDLIDQLKTNGVYLNAIPNDGSNEEIVVTMTDGIWDNLSSFSDTTIKILASALISGYEDYGIVVSDYDVYQHSQAKFVKIYFNDTANSVHGLQYYTTYDAKAMNFTMRSYSGELTQNQEETIKNVVDSIKYDKDPISVPSIPVTDPFVYTDTDTNTKFTVPANWCDKELSKEREFIDAKLVSTKEEGMTIMYGSTDVWEMLTYEEKIGLVRSDISNSYLSLEDISTLLDVDKNKLSKVNYNGIEYYQATIKSNVEMYGMDFKTEITHTIRFENGWAYWFQFTGTPDSIYFEDFELLLNSVQYPDIYDVGSTSPDNNTPNNNNLSASVDASGAIAVVVILVIVTIIVVAVIASSKKNKESSNDAQLSNTSTSTSLNVPESTNYCIKCGQALPLDSEFCHKCGTKIFKEDCSQ